MIESLETRSLLAVTPLLLGTELNIQSDAGEDIAVQANAGNVEILVDGAVLATTPSVAANTITSLIVNGDDESQAIDLSGVTSADYSVLVSIQLSGGDGNDVLTAAANLPTNLFGGDGDDVLTGLSAADVIDGGNGADTIVGGDAADVIDGGDGNDVITADDGDDTINGGNGNDDISGDDGADSITAGNGADTISGGDGTDILNGGDGNDAIDGDDENDTIFGGVGNDAINGGQGDDVVSAQTGNDTINGDDGNDNMSGDEGADLIHGNAGLDTLNGNAGNDTIYGDSGNDRLLGGSDNDRLFAGVTNIFDVAADADTLLGQSGNDTLQGDGGVDSMDGGAGDDVLTSGDPDGDNGVLISITDAALVTELDVGATVVATFTVVLSRVPTTTVTIDFATADGSAIAPGDYTAIPTTTMTFLAGAPVTQTISVTIQPDFINESNENFFVNLSNPNGGYIIDRQAEAVIVDDDGWRPAGPAPVINGQVQNISPNNEVSGAVQAVATSPTDPNVMFVGTVNGGIWRTTNATAAQPTWTPQTDFLTSLSIGDIAYDPNDLSGNTLVAGIGRSSSFGGLGGPSTGMLRTTDGGTTWTEINPAILQGQTILRVAARGNVLMAASDNRWAGGGGLGLFRSTDGGASFSLISDGAAGHLPLGQQVSDLVGDPTDPTRFYAAVRRVGIFMSTDSGATWSNVTSNIVGIGNATQNLLISVHATATTNAVYVGVISGGAFSGLFRSTNQGGIWTALDLPPATLNSGSAVHGAMIADPSNPNLVYLSGDAQANTLLPAVRVDASLAPGSQVTSIIGANAQNTQPHADARRMAVMANGVLVNGNDGGVVRRSNPQSNAGSWTSMNGNLQTLEAHDTDYDTVSNIIISGSQDNATDFQTATGSLTWTQIIGGDGGDVAIDTLAIPGQSIRYASSQNLGSNNGLAPFVFFQRRTYDAANNQIGATIVPAMALVGTSAAFQARFVTPFVTNAVAGDRLLLAGQNSLYESFNRADSITEEGVGLFVNNGNTMIYGGRIGAAVNANLIYIGVGATIRVRLGAPGSAFTTLVNYPGSAVQALTVDPNNFNTIFAADSNNRVWRSINGGVAWTNETGTLTATGLESLAYIGGASPTLVLGAQQGVFRMSLAALGNWVEMGAEALPNVSVAEMRYVNGLDMLVAGTFGRGAWTYRAASLGDQFSTLASGSTTASVTAGDMLIGGDGNDSIVGADGDDTLNGNAGNDSLVGGLGNDFILGGSGFDSLTGGAGNDTLDGQGGNDVIDGSDGSDTFVWNGSGDANDTVSSPTGYDRVRVNGSTAADTFTVTQLNGQIRVLNGSAAINVATVIQAIEFNLGNGDDTLTVLATDRVLTLTLLTINGENGNDTITAAGVNVGNVKLQLNGGAGNDSLTGSNGNDTLAGGDNNDRLDGGTGSDVLLGGTGNDRLLGGADNDFIFGGDDNDSVTAGDGNDFVSGDAGADTIDAGRGNDTASGGLGNDSLLAGDGDDSLQGNSGADTVFAGLGNDTLDGGGDADVLNGETGNDFVRGGDGNDTIDGGDGNDTMIAGDGNDSLIGGLGNDAMNGGHGNDNLNGGADSDTLVGGDGNDTLRGGAGTDTCLGSDGDDNVDGQGGTDKVAGNEGNDTVTAAASEIDEAFALPLSVLTLLEV